jgi:tripartite ATP-independent transporter DctP family solute receptor
MLKNVLKRILTCLVLTTFFTGVIFLGGCAKKEATKEEPAKKVTVDKITLRFAGTFPVNHYVTKADEMFKELVEKRTNGKVTIEFYPAQQLYSDKDLVDVVPRGGVELAQVNFGMWTGLVPELLLFDLYGFFENKEHYYHCEEDPQIRLAIEKALEEKANTKLVCTLAYSGGGPLLTKKVEKLEDLKGLKIRTQSEMSSYWVQTMGASPVVMSSGEVYQALQRKTIDGVLSGPTSYYDRKLYEVGKYIIKNYFANSMVSIVANSNTWNSLPKDVQDVMIQAGKEVNAWVRKASADEDTEAWKKLEAMPDMKIYMISEEEAKRWREKGVSIQKQKLVERVGKTGEQLFERAESLRKK